jgi:hypothetical protein
MADCSDYRTRVVTGDPGSGKSAVLAWVVLSSDPSWSTQFLQEPGAPDLPRGIRLVAVHARDRTLSEVVSIVARQCGSKAVNAEALVLELVTSPVATTVLIDALDEAREVSGIVNELIRPLSRTASNSSTRLVIGARRHIARQDGSRWVVTLDLDGEYADQDALRRHVMRILVDERSSPYEGKSKRALRVARCGCRGASRWRFVFDWQVDRPRVSPPRGTG